ncbi:MAG: selenium metabolism-associated LysR family transcriptional regulator [Anaerolineales bacterium]
MIDLNKLRAFLYAAEDLSFSKAARRMHLTQPTVSHHIKSLELEIGVELFDRSGSELQLTEAGRILQPWARKLIRQAIEMSEMMDSLQNKIVGSIRIACSTTTGKYLLPQLAARFHDLYPWVKITILSCTPDYVVPHLLEEDANLGVISREVSGDSIDCQEFFEDHIILIAPAEHPWVQRPFIEPTDILDEPFIVRERTSGTRRVMLDVLNKHDISLDDLNIYMEVGNAEAIVETVAAGFGVSFVSRLAAACALEQGKIVEVPVTDLDLRRKIFMIRRAIDIHNRAQEAFWGYIHDPSNQDLLRLAEG